MISYTMPQAFRDSKNLLKRYRKFLVAEQEDADKDLAEHFGKEIARIDECLREIGPVEMSNVAQAESKAQISWHTDRAHEYHVMHVLPGDAVVVLTPEKR